MAWMSNVDGVAMVATFCYVTLAIMRFVKVAFAETLVGKNYLKFLMQVSLVPLSVYE